MTEQFDPYYTWLGIPPEEQPANCYRLLGLRLFETNPQVIENAANRQMSHLRTFQVGPQSVLSQKLLNEVAAAKICLLNPAKRDEYDRLLRAAMEEPEEEEAMPALSSAPTRTGPSRKSKAPILAIATTVALLALLGAAIYGIYVAGSRPQPPNETARVSPPGEKNPAQEPSPKQPASEDPAPEPPGPVEPPAEPGPAERPGPDEPNPRSESPNEGTKEPSPPPEEPPAPSEADPVELLDQNRWLRINRPQPGVLGRLESDASNMAVNPVYALLATVGNLEKPAPVHFVGVGTKDDGKGGPSPAELAQRLNALKVTDRATCLAFSSSGQTLAVGNADGDIHVWNLRTGKEECCFRCGVPVRAVAVNQQERILASIDAEGKAVRLWSLTDRAPLRNVELPGAAAESLSFFSRGDVTVVGLRDGNVLVFDAYDDTKRTLLATNRGDVIALAAVRDNMILAGTADGSVTVFAPKPRFILGPFEPDEKPVAGLAVHGNSGLAAICGGDASIRLWQFVEGRAWARLEGQGAAITAVGFAQDGKTIFSLSADRAICAWNTPAAGDDALAERFKSIDPDAPVPKTLLAVPGEAKRETLAKTLLAEYELDRKRTLPEKQKVAGSLLEAARRAVERPDEYYILLTVAAEEARDSGEVVVLNEALSRLIGTFDCDGDRLSTEMLVGCADNIFQRDQAAHFVSFVEKRALEFLLDETRRDDAGRLSDAVFDLCKKDVAKEFVAQARILRDKIGSSEKGKDLPLPKRNTLVEWRKERYRAGLLKEYGGTVDSEHAVAAALEWLAAVQFPDGGWNFDHSLHPKRGGKATDPGTQRDARNSATALALLPFLAAGNTHRAGKYRSVVDRGLGFLNRRIQAEEFKGRVIGGSLYQGGESSFANPIGGRVFAEALAMSGDKRLAPSVTRLAAFSLAAEDPDGGGWNGYRVQRSGDVQVTLLQVQFLSVGGYMNGVLRKRVSHFLDGAQYEGGTRYHLRDDFTGGDPRADAAGLLLRVMLGCRPDNPALLQGIERFRENQWRLYDPSTSLAFSQLVFQAGGANWHDYNQALLEKFIPEQEHEGAEKGSWYYPAGTYSRSGGRLYSTATVTLVLQTYYRYPRINADAK